MNQVINPYAPPQAASDRPMAEPTGPPIKPPVRIFAGIMAASGTPFLPFALFPLLTPGLFVWLGWLMVALNVRWVNVRGFWVFSTLFNLFTALILLMLRNGDTGELHPLSFWIWAHLLAGGVFGSSIVAGSLESEKLR